MIQIARGIIILFFLSFFLSCNAPHDNLLDPVNTKYPFVSIEGTVQTFSVPYTGIAGVTVYWQSGNILVTTDSSGKYLINRIKPVNGKLIYSKEGYRTDTVEIIWHGVKKINRNVNLNKIPKLDSISIYTVVINQYYPSQTANLFIDAKISDSDNDISNVFIVNNGLNLNRALNFNVTSKIYQIELSTADLHILDIEETIGLNFNIVVKDIFNRLFNVGNEKVTRVIKKGVIIRGPANDTTISPLPDLQWQRYTPGYPFSYMIEIYTNDFANSQLIESKAGISPDSISYQVQNPLPAGDYYWVIWVIDKFKNRVRSLPATFRVK